MVMMGRVDVTILTEAQLVTFAYGIRLDQYALKRANGTQHAAEMDVAQVMDLAFAIRISSATSVVTVSMANILMTAQQAVIGNKIVMDMAAAYRTAPACAKMHFQGHLVTRACLVDLELRATYFATIQTAADTDSVIQRAYVFAMLVSEVSPAKLAKVATWSIRARVLLITVLHMRLVKDLVDVEERELANVFRPSIVAHFRHIF